jgi:hypothetical protein
MRGGRADGPRSSGEANLDQRISRLEQKLDQILAELRDLKQQRPGGGPPAASGGRRPGGRPPVASRERGGQRGPATFGRQFEPRGFGPGFGPPGGRPGGFNRSFGPRGPEGEFRGPPGGRPSGENRGEEDRRDRDRGADRDDDGRSF